VKRTWLAPVVLAIIAAGCDRIPVSPLALFPTPSFEPRDSTFTDDQVRAAVYTTYRWPAGFYQEPEYRVAPYYVNALSTKPLCCRPAADWRELATDDTAQARAWADSTVAYGSHIIPLASDPPIVTDRYIEFRPITGTRQPGVAMRAHRMSYLDPVYFRSAFFFSDSLVGTFNARPVDTTGVRGLAEYLWFKWHRDMGGFKVLSSFGSDEGGAVLHVVYDVETTYGDWNMQDDLRLNRLEFRVSKTTGEIRFRRILQRHVSGARH
jgi:hypothetical protein